MKSKLVNIIPITLITTFSLLLLNKSASADSPLTSTNIAIAYEDMEIVVLTQDNKKMEKKVLNFLLSDAPLDQKSAVINALGWNFDGQNNGYLFLQGLAESKGIKIDNLTLEDLNSSDKFVLGYLLAMDDYFNLSPLDINSQSPLFRITPVELLTSVALELPDNFTVHFVRALVESQEKLENTKSWCNIYQIHQLVLNQFPENKRNLRALAVDNIMDYINLYQESCNNDLTTLKIDVEKLKTENNQIVKSLDSVNNRLNTFKLGFFGLVDILVTGLLAIVTKIVFFPNP